MSLVHQLTGESSLAKGPLKLSVPLMVTFSALGNLKKDTHAHAEWNVLT
jgi:hypothetical protein